MNAQDSRATSRPTSEPTIEVHLRRNVIDAIDPLYVTVVRRAMDQGAAVAKKLEKTDFVLRARIHDPEHPNGDWRPCEFNSVDNPTAFDASVRFDGRLFTLLRPRSAPNDALPIMFAPGRLYEIRCEVPAKGSDQREFSDVVMLAIKPLSDIDTAVVEDVLRKEACPDFVPRIIDAYVQHRSFVRFVDRGSRPGLGEKLRAAAEKIIASYPTSTFADPCRLVLALDALESDPPLRDLEKARELVAQVTSAAAEVKKLKGLVVRRLEPPTCVLHVDFPRQIDFGGRTDVVARIENKSDTVVTLVMPGDGSAYGQRTPITGWSIPPADSDQKHPARRPPARLFIGCINRNAPRRSEIVALKPTESMALGDWCNFNGMTERLPRGKYRAVIYYSNIPNRDWSGILMGNASDDVWSAIETSDFIDLVSDEFHFEIV